MAKREKGEVRRSSVGHHLPNQTSHICNKFINIIISDAEYANCDRSQEQYDSQDSEIDVVYSPYPPGAIVWAKIAGYPW